MKFVNSAFRVAIALLTLAAVFVQLRDSLAHGRSALNFLSFFTIQSNVLVAIVLIVSVFSNRMGALRGAATLYIATTGIVYGLLLSGLEESLQTTLPWVNIVLHYVTPIAVVLDWIADPAPLRGSYARIVVLWLIYPLAYCVYSLVRGGITGWYPYPFMHPASGIGTVVVSIAGIAIADALLAMLVVWYSRGLSRGAGRATISR